MSSKSFYISEFGVVRSQGEYGIDGSLNTFKIVYLPKKAFDNVYNFVLENQESSFEMEKAFSISMKKGKRQIKVKSFVGVLETKDGYSLEILPKIFIPSITNEKEEIHVSKKALLKMIRFLKDSPFVHLNSAHINDIENFPILEVFILAFISEVEELIRKGVKSNYQRFEENLPYVKGKINVHENIRRNHVNRSKTACIYDDFTIDIPSNRIIKTTLIKLLRTTKNHRSKIKIQKLINYFSEIQESKNIGNELLLAKKQNRLMAAYSNLIKWAEVFLTNRSFTNFKGKSLNSAILFPMERIFEDYIAHLLKKYLEGYRIKLQDKSYFLVEKHIENGKFRLKPDFVASSQTDSSQIIIDTKWKILNQHSSKSNYNISQSDMYQLYAYGRKYIKNQKEPTLVLLYPANTNFNIKLDDFIYEGELVLKVIPFDFLKPERDEIYNVFQQINGNLLPV